MTEPQTDTTDRTEAASGSTEPLSMGRVFAGAGIIAALAGTLAWSVSEGLQAAAAADPPDVVTAVGYALLVLLLGYFGGGVLLSLVSAKAQAREGALAAAVVVGVGLFVMSSSEGGAPSMSRVGLALPLAIAAAMAGVTVGRRTPRGNYIGLFASIAYVVIGGVFVLGFAWALRPAVQIQNSAPCRPLHPEPREGAAVDFAVQDMAGNPVKLSDFAGKFVVLNFWATWCEPCITEWPQVSTLADRLADRDDIVVLAVSIDEDRTKIMPFLQRMSLQDTKVQVLWDPEQTLHTQFGTTKIPDTYFVDERGQLVSVFVNVREWGASDALYCLDSVVGR